MGRHDTAGAAHGRAAPAPATPRQGARRRAMQGSRVASRDPPSALEFAPSGLAGRAAAPPRDPRATPAPEGTSHVKRSQKAIETRRLARRKQISGTLEEWK